MTGIEMKSKFSPIIANTSTQFELDRQADLNGFKYHYYHDYH